MPTIGSEVTSIPKTVGSILEPRTQESFIDYTSIRLKWSFGRFCQFKLTWFIILCKMFYSNALGSFGSGLLDGESPSEGHQWKTTVLL
ncbi:hypothetical protein J3R74_003694 [Puniceicoccus vermicola]